MAVAGKVAITPKGLYVTGNIYDRLDMVSNNNKIYVARKSTNVEPTGTENTDDWMFIIESEQQNPKDLTQKIEDLQNEMENTYQKKQRQPIGRFMILKEMSSRKPISKETRSTIC